MKKCKRCGHKHEQPFKGIDCKLVNWKNELTKGLERRRDESTFFV